MKLASGFGQSAWIILSNLFLLKKEEKKRKVIQPFGNTRNATSEYVEAQKKVIQIQLNKPKPVKIKTNSYILFYHGIRKYLPTLAAAKETVLLDQNISVTSSIYDQHFYCYQHHFRIWFYLVTKLIFEVSFRYDEDFSNGIFSTNWKWAQLNLCNFVLPIILFI